MPEPNHPTDHFVVFSELPSNSSSKIRRQFPGSPTGPVGLVVGCAAGGVTTGTVGAVAGALFGGVVLWCVFADNWIRRSETAIRGRNRWPLARTVSVCPAMWTSTDIVVMPAAIGSRETEPTTRRTRSARFALPAIVIVTR